MDRSRHVLFVGGGSGGHIQPLLVVIRRVEEVAKEHGIAISGTYVGTSADLATPALRQLPAWCGRQAIPAGKLHRHVTVDQLRQTSRFIRGVLAARRLIERVRPDVVFAKGGFVSVPVAWAAKRKGIPVYCHESDAAMGLANHLVSRYASRVFTSFPPETYTALPSGQAVFSGQPVREAFFGEYSPNLSLEGRSLDSQLPCVTVIGGSQGARRLNELVRGLWKPLLAEAQLVHVTGPNDHAKLVAAMDELSEPERSRLWLVPFIQDELPALFHRSELIVSRAGGTIWEIAASGAPSILVPLSTAAQDHQRRNAGILAARGAARVFEETSGTPEGLWGEIARLLEHPEEREELSAAIRLFARPDAATVMSRYLLDLEG